MTYYELWQDAIKKLDHDDITLAEYDKLIAPLHREVDTLDKIRAEIKEERKVEHIPEDVEKWDYTRALDRTLSIIDKYRGNIK